LEFEAMMIDSGSDQTEKRAEAPPRAQYCLFDTAIGSCGLAFNERGLTRLRLAERDRAWAEKGFGTRAARASRTPREIDQLIADIQSYMSGSRMDFSAVRLDLTGIGSFEQAVYAAARRIPWGATTSYGELALQIGAPQAARAVGRALARNPVPIIVPCHRILGKGHRAGGFSAPGGVFTKQYLLALEGVHIDVGTPFFPGFN
jgi:methylated-DNA-[protein]-cysteine S-methyltransferase